MCVCICSTNVGILNELSLSSSHASRAISTALFTYTLCKCISMFGCVCVKVQISLCLSAFFFECVCTGYAQDWLNHFCGNGSANGFAVAIVENKQNRSIRMTHRKHKNLIPDFPVTRADNMNPGQGYNKNRRKNTKNYKCMQTCK